MKQCQFYLCAVLLFLFSHKAQAAAWSPEKNHGQIITTLSYYTIKNSIVDGDNSTTTTFHKTDLSSYGEIGWTDSLTLGAIPRFQSQSAEPETLSGEIFIRKKFWEKDNFVAAIQPLLQLPGSYSTADYAMVGGENSAQGELRLLAGYSNLYRNIPFFWSGEIGYRAAFNGQVNEWRLDNTLGVKILPNWLLMAQMMGVYRPAGIVQNTSYTTTNEWGDSQTVVYPIYYTHFDNTVQISLVHPITNTISIQFGAFSHIIEREEWIGKGILMSVWVNF